MRKIQPGGVLDTLKTLAARPEGVTSPELAAICGMDVGRASARLNKNLQRGHVFRSKRAGYILHWFDTAERAQAWAALPPMHKPELTAPVRKPMRKLGTDRKPGTPALTRFTDGASKLVSFAPDAPVKADGAIYTICPSGQDFRFTAIPEETPAIFAAKGGGLGVGRYLQEVAA